MFYSTFLILEFYLPKIQQLFYLSLLMEHQTLISIQPKNLLKNAHPLLNSISPFTFMIFVIISIDYLCLTLLFLFHFLYSNHLVIFIKFHNSLWIHYTKIPKFKNLTIIFKVIFLIQLILYFFYLILVKIYLFNSSIFPILPPFNSVFLKSNNFN